MSDLMRIGSSAMNAAYAQLQTTGQNIANAGTPGYVRREVLLQEAGDMGNDGWVGRGVDAVEVRRVYDGFLAREAIASRAAAAQDSARGDALARMDALFADPATGLGAAHDDLVSAFGDLAGRPADASARAAVLARADAFATRAAGLDARLLELRDAAQGRMQGQVREANDALAALAQINRRIGETRGASGEPNALLDERDRLLSQLNGVLRANATVADDGMVTVTSPRGEPLVVGASASRLVLSADPTDASRLALGVQRGNGTTLPMEATEVGGSLAGLMRFAGADVDAARAQLGRIVAAVAGGYNAAQARGLDAAGRPGEPLFRTGAPTVAAASGNTGTAQLAATVADPAVLRASDYSVSWDGSQYRIERLADGDVRTVASLPQTVDGLALAQPSGTAAAGDRFLLRAATAFASGLQALQVDPARLATAVPVAAVTGAANAGDLRAGALAVATPGAGNAATVQIAFTGPGTFDVVGAGTGNPTGVAYVPGMTVSYNGWTMRLDGRPVPGDTLTVTATADPAADNRNARAMQALGDAPIADGGSVIERYAELVGDVGARAQSARTSAGMSQRLHDDAERARSEVSGVNLDEEAARLMQYQQAYQAAAKVIATANEMFRTLLEAAG